MPLPRSLANLKREIAEKKCVEDAIGLGARPPRQSTVCQRNRSLMARWPVAPRGSRHGSTRSSQGTA